MEATKAPTDLLVPASWYVSMPTYLKEISAVRTLLIGLALREQQNLESSTNYGHRWKGVI